VAQVDVLKVELARLGPSPCDALEAVESLAAGDEEKESEDNDATPTAAEVDKIEQLMAMFPDADSSICLMALRANDGSVERALDWILSSMG
jgi:hypothetical protein